MYVAAKRLEKERAGGRKGREKKEESTGGRVVEKGERVEP